MVVAVLYMNYFLSKTCSLFYYTITPWQEKHRYFYGSQNVLPIISLKYLVNPANEINTAYTN